MLVQQGDTETVATEPVFERILFQREKTDELSVLPVSIVSLPAPIDILYYVILTMNDPESVLRGLKPPVLVPPEKIHPFSASTEADHVLVQSNVV